MGADSLWKSLLLTLCAVAFAFAIGNVGDQWGVGGRPWFGFFDATNTPNGKPFVLENGGTSSDGATARAGIRDGDWIDLRELSFDVRFREVFQPLATQRIIRKFHRGKTTIAAPFTGSTVWDGAVKWKLGNQIPELLAKLWLCACALLISIRKAASRDARLLALAILGIVIADSMGPSALVLPSAMLSAFLQVGSAVFFSLAIVALVVLALPYGKRGWFRTVLEWSAYLLNAVSGASGVAGIVGLLTLWFDPLPLLFGQLWYWIGISGSALALVVAIVAVATASDADRPRAIWLLLPLPLAVVASQVLSQLNGFISDWYLFILALMLSNVALALGALSVTYAILKRRVLDFGFVLNRTLVLGSVSLVVVAAFAVLEATLAIFFASASRNAVILVSALFTLVLGLAMPRVYGWLDGAVERYFFAREYRARQNVLRLSAGLPFAESAESIDATLTTAMCRAFHLPSATVFRRIDDGKFARVASQGWMSGETIDDIDVQRIAMALEAEPIVAVEDLFLEADRLPSGEREPAVILGLRARQSLIGFVCYSARSHGVQFDPDERALLVRLSQEASRGYDAVELAKRVEVAYQGRMAAEEEAKETLRRSNATLERINEAQARFMPNEFLRFLGKESITDVALGDSIQERMTVLFSDIRSFTTLSEGMSPAQIFSFLNRYLQRAEPIIAEHGGFIDKYIGDAVMGLFPKSADDALLAGIGLQREVRVLNRKLRDEGQPELAIGVGLHTGELMLGTIGGRNRMETTVIADAVNASSRLESATKTFGCAIVLSSATRSLLSDPERFMLRNLGPLHVKGKHEALDVYEAFDADIAELLVHKQQTLPQFAEALAAFTALDYDAAVTLFSDLARANAFDGPARYYAALSEELRSGVVAG